MAGAKGLVTLMKLLQGERAAKFRAAEADVVRCLGGDLSREVQGIRQAQEVLAPCQTVRSVNGVY